MSSLRNTGIEVLGEVPWGTHFCQFYHTPQDLTEILVPYFASGLEADEFCMWVASQPLDSKQARSALARSVKDLDRYIEQGQIEFLDYNDWYTAGGCFESQRVLDGWVSKLEGARERGFEGLRLTGNTFWLEQSNWQDFVDYEAAIDRVLGKYRMLAMCAYSLEKCGAAEIMDVVSNHEFALIKRASQWELIQSGERIRSKKGLQESRNQLQILADQIPGGAIYQYVLPPEGEVKYSYMSAGVERLLGFSAERVMADPRSFRQLIVEEDRARVTAAEEQSAKELAPFDCEFRQRAVSGEIKWVQCRSTPRRLPDGSIVWDGVVTDITERKRAEERINWSSRRNQLLSDTAGRLLMSDNPQGLVEDLCRQVMDFLDCQAFFNFLLDDSSKRLRLNACDGIPREEASKIEWLDFGVAVCGCVARDGRRITAEDIQNTPDSRTELVKSYGIQAYCCHPLLIGERVIGTLSFGTRTRVRFSRDEVDVMQAVAYLVSIAMHRVQAEHILRESEARLRLALESEKTAKTQAEEASRAKDRFLAALSHELRTPLTPILAGAQLLSRREDLPSNVYSTVAIIKRNVELEARLIDDLLDLSRIVHGKVQLCVEKVDIDKVIKNAVEICRPKLSEKSQEVELYLNARDTLVSGDIARLQQIFWNIIINSVKFTPELGRVTIETKNEAQDVLIRITDTGQGIDPELAPKLFSVFEQGEAGQFGGLGLGLSITKSLVELHHGSISASSPGRDMGCTISVRFPILGKDAETGAGAAASGNGTRPEKVSKRILLVEDNQDTGVLIRTILDNGGHIVHFASDVASALKAAEKQNFDLLLCDIGLPDGSGLDIVSALRESKSIHRAVAMTGFGMEEDIRKCKKAGFDTHLTKPVDIDELERLIDVL